jgi:hypothetical protein
MTHLLLHAAGNMRSRGLRMIQLHDIAKLAVRLKPGDWQEILSAGSLAHASWWAMPPLLLTARYYSGAIPAFVLDSADKYCARRLLSLARRQTISDVSWSNVRVEALPGIEWSRSPREALVFFYRRLMPSAETRLELKRFSTFHARGSEIPWYNISQAARIWRWAFSRPPRVQTLLSVRAALSGQNDRPLDPP